MIKYKYRIFCLSLVLLLLNAGCSPKKDTDKVLLSRIELQWLKQHEDELYFSPDPSYAPFEFYDSNEKKYRGLAHDYIRSIENKTGIHLKIINSGSFDKILSLAREKKVSIVNAATSTPERNEYLLFTSPFVEIKNVILVKDSNPKLRNVRELAGKKISIVQGYAVTEYLENNYPYLKLNKVPKDYDAILNVVNGVSDAAIIDLATASYLINKEGITNIYVSGDVGYPIKLAIGSRKDWPELNSILQKGLNAISDNEREAINSKWIHLKSISILDSNIFRAALAVICFLVIVALSVFIWNKQLNRKIKQKTAELNDTLNELKISEARLRTLVQTIPDLIWLKDRDGVYLACNTTFERFFGAREADIIGKTDYDFVDRELADFFREKDRAAMAAGKPSVNEEWITFADDGHMAMLETIKTPMYNSSGVLIGVLGIGRDITERKQSEERISALLAEKQILLQEVHHRIKNNMNTIRGLLSLQIAEEKNSAAEESLLGAEMRVNSMIKLYDRLYSNDNYRELSVKNYLQSLAEDIIFSFPNSVIISLEAEIEDHILNVNLLTPLGIIVNELLTNAMKHAFKDRENGKISVAMSFTGNSGKLIVRDNGIGIQEPVNIGDSAGFGLNLVSMIVEQINGTIKIDHDNGTIITLNFEIL